MFTQKLFLLHSMVSTGENFIGSQFFFTLGADLTALDGIHCVIGEVVEGHEILRLLNEAIVDEKHRPYKDIRITHTVVLEDPYANPRGFREPSRSPSPTAERLKNGRIAADEDIDDTQGKTEAEVHEMLQDREAKARATILEIIGDVPDADVAPPENVLFVCKLNPVTTDDDLQIIFSRFGRIKTCEVIRDKVSGDSLQYAFIEFEEQKSCEDAYFKMDNVLIDDRRIHVDFSQSVSKIKWRGKGNYTIHDDSDNFKSERPFNKGNREIVRRSRSPRRDNNRPRYQDNRMNQRGNNERWNHDRGDNDRRNDRGNGESRDNSRRNERLDDDRRVNRRDGNRDNDDRRNRDYDDRKDSRRQDEERKSYRGNEDRRGGDRRDDRGFDDRRDERRQDDRRNDDRRDDRRRDERRDDIRRNDRRYDERNQDRNVDTRKRSPPSRNRHSPVPRERRSRSRDRLTKPSSSRDRRSRSRDKRTSKDRSVSRSTRVSKKRRSESSASDSSNDKKKKSSHKSKKSSSKKSKKRRSSSTSSSDSQRDKKTSRR